MLRVFFLALLFEHMLSVRQRIVGIKYGIGRLRRNVLDRPIVPIRLAEVSDNRKRQPALEYNNSDTKKYQQPGSKCGCLVRRLP